MQYKVDSDSIPQMFSSSIIKWVVLAVFLAILLKSMFVFIPAGYVGAVYGSGRGVLPNSFKEGLNVIIPFWQKVELFDARIQEYTMSATIEEGAVRRDDALDAPTSDGQQVKVDATILFHIDQNKVPELWKNVGTNYIDKLVRTISRSQARMVISRYSATAIYSEKRQEAEKIMTREISDLLKKNHIIVDRVLLRAVNFSPEYSQAIEQKVIAEQRVKQAEFEVKEATQRAQSKIAEAKGLAEAQALQKASLTAEYLQLEAIKKWNGVMPQVVGSENAPFINIPLR